MKLVLQHIHLRPADRLDRWIAPHLARLQPLLAIEAAYLRIEHRADSSPPFLASIHLVIPGPDIRLEAVDHTARTAVAKLLAELSLRARQRAARRVRSWRAAPSALVSHPTRMISLRAGRRV